ncbi:FecCD family ABC transporter permease [Helicobacter cappadocius]|uniref:Iron ABC transporter permease n=1 Tax=Helicobacter cappadocius TaxID=3063998 RepID=A0AA90TF00_9HELI|nr:MULTISPECIES: iron ABC transporter permease [unclassified Helicobacter]MDO7253226.1 iron ABC transporter permease [Helicobacter sp. faydin-H75]MDP2539150.1 iron ABC transporter permease [Helicobacter sp. faydin-H76]
MKKISVYALVVILAFIVLFLGASDIAWNHVWGNIYQHIFYGVPLNSDGVIVYEIRLPRVILAIIVGAILSGSGAIMQSMFKNPLIDPFLLGISSGAAFGCALSIGLFENLPLGILAFAGALGTSLLVIFIGKFAGGSSVSLVLSGVILSAFLSALSGSIKFFVDPQKAQAIVIWLLGSLSLASWDNVKIALLGVVIGFVPLFLLRWKINILGLGDSECLSLGISPYKMRFICIVCVSFACALAVSVSGTIGWIGLVVPHLGRILFGSDMRKLLPGSLALGALLLLGADTIARTLTSYDLPVGIVTAILGAPFFIFLLSQFSAKWNGR